MLFDRWDLFVEHILSHFSPHQVIVVMQYESSESRWFPGLSDPTQSIVFVDIALDMAAVRVVHTSAIFVHLEGGHDLNSSSVPCHCDFLTLLLVVWPHKTRLPRLKISQNCNLWHLILVKSLI